MSVWLSTDNEVSCCFGQDPLPLCGSCVELVEEQISVITVPVFHHFLMEEEDHNPEVNSSVKQETLVE